MVRKPPHSFKHLVNVYKVRLNVYKIKQWALRASVFWTLELRLELRQLKSTQRALTDVGVNISLSVSILYNSYVQELLPGDEIANVNFLRRHRTCTGQRLSPLNRLPRLYHTGNKVSMLIYAFNHL